MSKRFEFRLHDFVVFKGYNYFIPAVPWIVNELFKRDNGFDSRSIRLGCSGGEVFWVF